ncbi:hypothetical protein E5082_30240 [Streptomyces griseoluteus]|uniref:4-hydroxy-3-methylbut-2-enyl diphosphate reductase n=1 Tax=Streptomyces griseoluteus TaxID=29306 RepID=A0A4Z1CYF4_STRGP|nr:hypothetical protein E5082_30240 [Streptomyces griseoluteus]
MVEVALAADAWDARLVDCAEDVDDAWLMDVTTVGVTSGASVPDIPVQDVLTWRAQHGWDDVQTIITATESIAFSPSKGLRRDLRAETGHREE